MRYLDDWPAPQTGGGPAAGGLAVSGEAAGRPARGRNYRGAGRWERRLAAEVARLDAADAAWWARLAAELEWARQ
jgi:hypothetical protein